MSDGVDVSGALDFWNAGVIGCDVAKQIIQRHAHVAHGSRKSLPRLLPVPDFDDGLAANSIDFAAADPIVLVLIDPLKIGGNDLKLQGGTSGIQNQDIHERCFRPRQSCQRRER